MSLQKSIEMTPQYPFNTSSEYLAVSNNNYLKESQLGA